MDEFGALDLLRLPYLFHKVGRVAHGGGRSIGDPVGGDDLHELLFLPRLPPGVVMVQAFWGVEELDWMPVFIYASLSRQTYMKLSFRSAAPERDWRPMSKVPPSPAKARVVMSSRPCSFRACAMPDAVGAAISKAEWKHGTEKVLFGYVALITPTHDGRMTTMVFSPRTLSTSRMVVASPHPGQAMWPGLMYSLSIS